MCYRYALLAVAISIILGPTRAQGQTLAYEIQGGPQLTIRAKAEQQQWRQVSTDRIMLAAVIDGRLVIVEYYWPSFPTPGPGPDPGPGPQPKPPPQPEPQPGKHWQVLICIETDQLDNLTPAQQSMLASALLRKDLPARGHRFIGVLDADAIATITDARLKTWTDAVRGRAPCVAIAPLEGGTIRVYPLPESMAALMKLLDNPPVTRPLVPCPPGRCP